MRIAKTLIVLLLALVWVPLTAHCEIKAIPGLEFLQCHCDDTDPAGTCGDTECCVLETGAYHPAQTDVPLCPVVDLADFVSALVSFKHELSGQSVVIPAPQLPEAAKPWQFSYRTALPVRAPSFAL